MCIIMYVCITYVHVSMEKMKGIRSTSVLRRTAASVKIESRHRQRRPELELLVLTVKAKVKLKHHIEAAGWHSSSQDPWENSSISHTLIHLLYHKSEHTGVI